MAFVPGKALESDSNTATGAGQHIDAPQLQLFVMALFFIFGGITSLNDVIIPKLKELFTLNYTQAMLVQFCFFTAYAVIGIPGARLIKRIGYMRGAVAGLLTMMVGCLLFIPARLAAVMSSHSSVKPRGSNSARIISDTALTPAKFSDPEFWFTKLSSKATERAYSASTVAAILVSGLESWAKTGVAPISTASENGKTNLRIIPILQAI
jgi:MFS family permease